MYDVVIIGAGISGLVCGCYLAKAGMKVLIVEQHTQPGGYCTSFKRQGFTFDAAPHCFGSYREEGIMRKILRELTIDTKINIVRSNPSDTIVTPDCKLSFWNDIVQTIEEFQLMFHKEKNNIKSFFGLLVNTEPKYFSRLRSITFQNLLDQNFADIKLKAILSMPFLGIGGLSSSMISAFVGAKLYSEFIFDGGYYPVKGMQSLPDVLTERFKSLGGELRLSCLAKRIKIRDNRVMGVVLEKDGFIPSKYVVSCCDARQTFLKLVGKEKVSKDFYQRLKKMMPAFSNFLIYLGIDSIFDSLPQQGTAFSVFTHYNIDKAFKAINKFDIENYGGYMIRVLPDRPAIFAGIPAPFKNEAYWNKHKEKTLNYMISKIEQYSIPNLSSHIIYRGIATPNTLFKYTLNYKGASYGWAGIPTQFAMPDIRKPSFINNLYLSGHWTTLGVGISGAAYVGSDTAKIILRGKF